MTETYDKYYQTENLFGEPYPELIHFFTHLPVKGKVLDLGCGQGRDSIALARIGFNVTGIDKSKVGINQMNRICQNENLTLVGKVEDIYEFNEFDKFEIILLDSIFHFGKKDKRKEIELIKKIVMNIRKGSLIAFFIQDTGEKVHILNQSINFQNSLKRLTDLKFKYSFEDKENDHKSVTDYRMIVVEK